MNEMSLKLKRQINDVSQTANLQKSTVNEYGNNLMKYDIIISDWAYKVEQTLNYTKNFEANKVDKRDIVPKLARMDRDITNLKVEINKLSGEERPKIIDKKDDLKGLVEMVTQMADHWTSQDQLEVLKSFVQE